MLWLSMGLRPHRLLPKGGHPAKMSVSSLVIAPPQRHELELGMPELELKYSSIRFSAKGTACQEYL